ncbi:MAG: hypothetical protein AAGH65_05185 [Pseudomonadota bacterium]
MQLDLLLVVLLWMNAIWFALGFHLFSLRGVVFAKTLVAKPHRDSSAFAVLVASGRFLGGFNAALCVLSVLLALQPQWFPEPQQRMVLCLFFALAHGSQFGCNVPIAWANRTGGGVWQVRSTMRLIFVVDGALMLANAVAAWGFAVGMN